MENEYVYNVSVQFKKALDKLKETNPKLKIYYFYPTKFTSEPCISYKLAGNVITDKTINNKPRRQEASYYVDFWGSSPEQLQDLSEQLKNILTNEGYTCTFEQDLKDTSEIYYHKSTRFQIYFDNKLKIVL